MRYINLRLLTYLLTYFDQRSCATSDPVSTRMGDHLWMGKPFRYVTSQLGQLSLLPSVGRYNEYQLSGWVIIINGHGGCSFWQPVQADSQPKSSGLVLGLRPLGAVLHSSNEPNELSQWLVLIIIIIIIIYLRCSAQLDEPTSCESTVSISHVHMLDSISVPS